MRGPILRINVNVPIKGPVASKESDETSTHLSAILGAKNDNRKFQNQLVALPSAIPFGRTRRGKDSPRYTHLQMQSVFDEQNVFTNNEDASGKGLTELDPRIPRNKTRVKPQMQ